MIASLLDVSRISMGKLSIERAPVDLGALVRRVIAETQPTAELHRLVSRLPEDRLVIIGDELRLEQVIQNLISNAVKYSPHGGPVTVQLEQRDWYAWVSVTDQGIGIPRASLARLFQRFYRAENADQRRISGMGIGLYVVKEIVDLHGGTVGVTSTEGEGSTFTVCLPLLEETLTR